MLLKFNVHCEYDRNEREDILRWDRKDEEMNNKQTKNEVKIIIAILTVVLNKIGKSFSAHETITNDSTFSTLQRDPRMRLIHRKTIQFVKKSRR